VSGRGSRLGIAALGRLPRRSQTLSKALFLAAASLAALSPRDAPDLDVAITLFVGEVDPALFEDLGLRFAAPPAFARSNRLLSRSDATAVVQESTGVATLGAELAVVRDFGLPDEAAFVGLYGGAQPGPHQSPRPLALPWRGEDFQCLCWVVRWDPEPVWYSGTNPSLDGPPLTVLWYPALVISLVDARTGETYATSASGARRPLEERRDEWRPPPWGR
jgi:hypothetical protein